MINFLVQRMQNRRYLKCYGCRKLLANQNEHSLSMREAFKRHISRSGEKKIFGKKKKKIDKTNESNSIIFYWIYDIDFKMKGKNIFVDIFFGGGSC